MKKYFKVLIYMSFFAITSFAGEVKNSDSKGFAINEMHGYKLSDFSGFEKKWKMVTVRFYIEKPKHKVL